MEHAIFGRRIAFPKQSGVAGSWNAASAATFRRRFNYREVLSLLNSKKWRASNADLASVIALDWRPAFDEVLLMSSVLLAYVAGVVSPSTRSSPVLPKKNIIVQSKVDVWDRINVKLGKALATSNASQISRAQALPTLCLQALSYGPSLRLLLMALTMLRNEMRKPVPSMNIASNLVGPVCRAWVLQEQRLKNEELSSSFENAAMDYISKTTSKSGKRELHSDVLFFLSNSTMRPGSTLDEEVCKELSECVLEDLVVTIAEGAAAMYLGAFASSSSGWSPLLRASISSTRALERFQNEVALQQWIHYNFHSVAAIYEDRIHLWTLKTKTSEERAQNKKQNTKKTVEGMLEISSESFPLRRVQELRALSGWRYYYSLYLELSDILGPLLRIVISKLGQGVSFLLVCLIGRSFGLIYQGIRQSVKWSG